VAVALVFWQIEGTSKRRGSRALELYGNVDIREVNLGFRVGGRLAQVLCEEGDEVQAGEAVARLDDDPYRRELEEARAQAESAAARVALLEAGNRPQEIAQARATLREREVTFANAERIFNRQQELLASKAVSIQERDDAEARWREAEARVKSAREHLALLEAGFRPEEIRQAKADLSRARALVSVAELRVEDTALKSPCEGVVLTRAQEPGAILQAGTTVLTVSHKNPVWIRAYVSEPDLGRVSPGTKVEIFTDSRPGRPYSGQVGYISPRAEFTPKNVETIELRTSLVYRIRITVENPDAGLRQGMPVTIRLRAPAAQGTAGQATKHAN
jgi:HlyD family secretion protein